MIQYDTKKNYFSFLESIASGRKIINKIRIKVSILI